MGCNQKIKKYFFEKIATDKYDFIVIDTHREGKLRIRKKLAQPIEYFYKNNLSICDKIDKLINR